MQSINMHDGNKDFKPTAEEMNMIKDKMKDPEFMRLWTDYMKDLQDPKYRAEEEAYLKQVEREAQEGGDYSFEFIFPKPVFCVELRELGKSKLRTFINVCECDKVEEPTEQPGGDRNGAHWFVPVSIGKPRKEQIQGEGKGAANVEVDVYDAVFHSKAIFLANKWDRFMCFIIEIAVENINGGYATSFGFEFSRCAEAKFGKAIGTPANQTVKKRKDEKSSSKDPSQPVSLGPIKVAAEAAATAAPPVQTKKTTTAAAVVPAASNSNNGKKEPKFTVVHRGHVDLTDAWNWKTSEKRIGVPAQLAVKITVPEVSRAADLDVDILSDTGAIRFVCEKHGYDATLPLPFRVEEEPVEAKFDKARHDLHLVLTVIPPQMTEEQAQAMKEAKEKMEVEKIPRVQEVATPPKSEDASIAPNSSLLPGDNAPSPSSNKNSSSSNSENPSPSKKEERKVEKEPSGDDDDDDEAAERAIAEQRRKDLFERLEAMKKQREEFEAKEKEKQAELARLEKEKADAAEALAKQEAKAAEAEKAAAEAQQKSAKSVAFADDKKPLPPADNKDKQQGDIDESKPEVVDLRDRQREWMEQQKREEEKRIAEEEAAAKKSAQVVLDLMEEMTGEESEEQAKKRAEEAAAAEEAKRKLRAAEKQQKAEREAERLEAELNRKMKDIPLRASLIFAIE